MKLTVKTLKGSHFQIGVKKNDTIMAVKKIIEDVQGKDNYPFSQQLLIHNGKVLKDESTLAENKIFEDGFLVVMLSKSKPLGSSGSASSEPAPTSAPASTLSSVAEAPPTDGSFSTSAPSASNLNGGNNLDQSIQQLIDMGGGNWDKEMVARALRVAYNNPERAVDYLYSGIPESTEVPLPLAQSAVNSATTSAPLLGAPNSSPLNLFPQETISGNADAAGSLDFLRNNQQFQALRSMVQANPQILQGYIL